MLRIVLTVFGDGVIRRRGALHDLRVPLQLTGALITPIPGRAAIVSGDIDTVVGAVIVVSIESAARGGARIRQGGEPAEFLKVHFEVKSHTVTEAYLVQILLGNRNGFKSRSRNAGRILSRSGRQRSHGQNRCEEEWAEEARFHAKV